tara:strand:+ start:1841 stop:2437 length:597 start_codon:yes stop_codon:yes gene_type:complete
MKTEYKDFIGIFSDVYPEGFCEHLINEFEKNKEFGAGNNRQNSEGVHKHQKDDYSILANGKNCKIEDFFGENAVNLFFSGLQNCYEDYANTFSSLKAIKIIANDMKMQKTSPGGGYHLWHAEQGNDEKANRGLVYTLYLNTLPPEANGETEFLYQQRRINPVENTMVLWPAAFTHTHRGNPVYEDNAKYIITGWFYHE